MKRIQAKRFPRSPLWPGLALLLSTMVAFVAQSAPAADAPPEALAEAHNLYLRGKYAEAEEKFEALADQLPVKVAVGRARCQLAVGETDKAIATLQAGLQQQANSPSVLSLLAEIDFQRGKYPEAKQYVDATLKVAEENPRARWIDAELFRVAGQLEEAEKGYEWFIDFYNNNYESITDSDDLRYVGLAAAELARWTQNHDQFSFLVNDLYPDTLKLNENYWRGHLESGLLFLEKFNEADASQSFNDALKLNSNAADVHAAVAQMALQNADLAKAKTSIDRALEINPNHLTSRLLKADLQLATFEPSAAIPILEEALPLCQVSEATLGRLAAAQACVEGLKKPLAESRIGQLIDEVTQRNPKAGEFYETIGQSLDSLRHYPEAAHYYSEAYRVMPQRVSVPGKLGWVYMRLGKEKKARELLERAMEVNFGNARVKNGLTVLDVLDGYETLETEHFLIRYDPEHDQILAENMARHLEKMYPVLCERLGYFPEEKSLFEIFNKARNTGAHGWFSARMVGLPHIHTIGACGGQMVAMVSPNAMDKKFNWARVLEHEFVHMVNLQQTNFNIPHWYTEALAVLNEGYPRSPEWNEMLARRVPAGEVFNLDSINQGFIRPTSSEDWQMAYCQAELYAEYMLERFGEDSLAKMLAGYADNLNTPATIQRELNVTVEDFEAGYTEFIKKAAAATPSVVKEQGRKFTDLQKILEKNPEDAEATAELALAYLSRKAYPKAGQLAKKSLALKPGLQAAVYVQLRLQMLIGNDEGLAEKVEQALDRDQPDPRMLRLLAKLKYEAKEFEAAAELYKLGHEKFPGDNNWVKFLARAYDKLDAQDKLVPIMQDLATADADDLQIRLRLAKIGLDGGNYQEAADWANQALHIDVMNVDAHRILAEASAELKDQETALREYRVTIEIAPDKPAYRMSLAKYLVEIDKQDEARVVLEELLEQDAEYEGAKELLEKISPSAAVE